MRVTERTIFEGANQRSAKARERFERAVEEAGTGLRVTHPGDDAVAAGLIVAHRTAEAQQDAVGTTALRASDELVLADQTLGTVGNLLTRAREIAIQLSNATYDANQRSASVAEVQALFNEMLALANTRMGERFLFGGQKDDTQPFDAAGVYQGSPDARKLQLGPGAIQDVSVQGDLTFGAAGGVDMFATLATLAADLGTNNIPGIQTSMGDLDTAIKQLATARTTAGGAMALVDVATLASRDARDAETTAISHLQDADMIDASSRLALAQRALDAAITASAKGFELTLLNKLR